jgi:hypothetical protein
LRVIFAVAMIVGNKNTGAFGVTLAITLLLLCLIAVVVWLRSKKSGPPPVPPVRPRAQLVLRTIARPLPFLTQHLTKQ